MDSPLQRTLKMLRDAGWTVGITEHFNPHVRIRQDLFGFADAIAFRKGFPVLALNAMHLKHSSEHDKLRENEALRKWIEAGHRFALYQWHQVGPRGKRKLWKVFVQEWKLDDMRRKKAQSSGERLAKKGLRDGKAHAKHGGGAHGRSARAHRANSSVRVGKTDLMGEKHSR